MARITRTITTSNQFTDPVKLRGYFNLSISGTWEGAVTLQRSFDLGSTWLDVDAYTENAQEYGLEPEHSNVVLYRIGSKDGAFVSGACALRLSN